MALDYGRLDFLIEQHEDDLHDFKRDLFKPFKEDKESFYKLVKDIAGFANLDRKEDAYIIFGVDETPDNGIEVIGITGRADLANIKHKISDYLQPPVEIDFGYYNLDNGKQIAAIRIPPSNSRLHVITGDAQSQDGLRFLLRKGEIIIREGTSNRLVTADDIRKFKEWIIKMSGNKEPILRAVFENEAESIRIPISEKMKHIKFSKYTTRKSLMRLKYKEFFDFGSERPTIHLITEDMYVFPVRIYIKNEGTQVCGSSQITLSVDASCIQTTDKNFDPGVYDSSNNFIRDDVNREISRQYTFKNIKHHNKEKILETEMIFPHGPGEYFISWKIWSENMGHETEGVLKIVIEE